MPIYEFVCTSCDAIHESVFKSQERPTHIDCENCSQPLSAEYRVGKPAMFRVKFDQNGRIGYKYDMGNGKQQIRSATRENYEHNLGNRTKKDLKEMGTDRNKSVYTKEYDRHVRSTEKQKVEKANKELKSILKTQT